MTAGVRLHVNQDNIWADPANAVPGNDKFVPSVENAKQAARAGDNNGNHLPRWDLHLYIGHKTQPSAVTNADDFLAVQIRYAIAHNHTPCFFGRVYASWGIKRTGAAECSGNFILFPGGNRFCRTLRSPERSRQRRTRLSERVPKSYSRRLSKPYPWVPCGGMRCK